MLLNNLFQIAGVEYTKESLKAVVSVETDHEIFAGHFPGMPVVPGVCMIELVKETIESLSSKRYLLTRATNVKFLSVLNPRQHNKINLLLNFSESGFQTVTIDASLFFEDITFFKLKATLEQSQ